MLLPKLSCSVIAQIPGVVLLNLPWGLLLSGDQSVYVDMSFFNELQSRYGAKVSEFTVAYVLGHEIGHHVQTLLGTTQK